MTRITRIFRSSLGKKFLMATTGLMLVVFLAGHLAGNLLIYAGPDTLNAYALKLRKLPAVLWGARIILLVAIAVHLWTSSHLARQNRAARPTRYAAYRPSETTWYARTMIVSGLLLLAFIVYHLLHFTFQVADPVVTGFIDPLGHHDVYRMVVHSFQQPVVSLAYIIAMAVLFSHLRHGIASTAQTLGINNARTIVVFEWAGAALSWAFFLGYASIPLAILFGVIG